MQVEIYDPPMCCSSGVCGPAVDFSLIKINNAILALKKQGVEVERYSLSTDHTAFIDNEDIR